MTIRSACRSLRFLSLAGLLLTTACAPRPHNLADEPANAPLPLGSTAPDFTLSDAKGNTPTLSQITKIKPVLLIFYLGYSCPRCVSHLRELADRKAEFDAYNVQILAIGPDSVTDSQDSIESYGDFPFPLLSDPDLATARRYRMLVGKDTLFHGAYIIDTHNKIRFATKASHPYNDWQVLLNVLADIEKKP